MSIKWKVALVVLAALAYVFVGYVSGTTKAMYKVTRSGYVRTVTVWR